MKKLNLKTSSLPKGEILTRMQLKEVLGGVGSGQIQDCFPLLSTITCKDFGNITHLVVTGRPTCDGTEVISACQDFVAHFSITNSTCVCRT